MTDDENYENDSGTPLTHKEKSEIPNDPALESVRKRLEHEADAENERRERQKILLEEEKERKRRMSKRVSLAFNEKANLLKGNQVKPSANSDKRDRPCPQCKINTDGTNYASCLKCGKRTHIKCVNIIIYYTF